MIRDTKKRIMISLEQTDIEKLEELCKTTGMTKSEQISLIIKCAYGEWKLYE